MYRSIFIPQFYLIAKVVFQIPQVLLQLIVICFGVTIHFVDQTLDGGKIISQVAVPYEGNDVEELEAMIHKAEHRLYVDTVNKLIK